MVADSIKRALYSILFIGRTVSIATTTTTSFDINKYQWAFACL